MILNNQFLDALDEFVFIVDTEYKILAFNKSFSSLYFSHFNVYPEIGKEGLMNNSPNLGEIVKSSFQRGFSGERFKISKQVNGVYLEFTVSPIFDVNQKVESLVVSARETTQTNNLIKKVSAQEEKYQYVVENIHDVIFQTDAVGNWTFLNKAWTEIFQYTVQESINTPFYSYLHPDDVRKNELLFEPLINRKKKFCRHVIRYITKAGKVRWIKVFATLLINEENEIIGTTGTLRDITDEKVNEHFNELLLNNVRDLICIHNQDGTYLFVSPSIEDLTGFKPYELIGKSPYDFFHPDDLKLVEKRHQEILKVRGDSTYISYRFLKKNGDYVWVESNSKIFFDEYEIENRIITSTHEIQERKLAEESMMKALHKEKELNELKSRFVAMTTHEFKTPLSTISSSAEIIEMYAERTLNVDTENIIKQVKNINVEVLRMTDMMDSSLFLEKIEANKTEVNKEEIALVSLVQYIIDRQVRHQKDKRKLYFELRGTVRKVFADAQHLEHILDNLISNAFKYSQNKPNPVLILTFNENNFTINIIDYGLGIPQNQHKKVYSSFFRGDNVRDIKGTGLGLLIVHNLVKMNGGKITFESEENQGTTFTLEFPYF
ncbi:PAS domain-containing sensor histidine kinase [Arcicella sp. DC2W]|uniref:histidine kinase n=1 Tax=Arcicella gelida TaxID=2984195 RepID=A0ABU5S4I7_9BACT|nr:PAS domain-containing sensor histidine kinase [Arcicella sp. DC2W]MEA5403301.1 PAS domain-containing sensor histidine kinase [Arcicella sp. DC2W]